MRDRGKGRNKKERRMPKVSPISDAIILKAYKEVAIGESTEKHTVISYEFAKLEQAIRNEILAQNPEMKKDSKGLTKQNIRQKVNGLEKKLKEEAVKVGKTFERKLIEPATAPKTNVFNALQELFPWETKK